MLLCFLIQYDTVYNQNEELLCKLSYQIVRNLHFLKTFITLKNAHETREKIIFRNFHTHIEM